MPLDIIPTGAAAGAEICGVDLTNTLDDNAYQTLNQALGEHGVIFFRGTGGPHAEQISPEEQLQFAEQFGPINVNRFFPKVFSVLTCSRLVQAHSSWDDDML